MTVSREKHATVIYDPRSAKFFVKPGEGNELSYLNDSCLFDTTALSKGDILTLGNAKLLFVPQCGEEFKLINLNGETKKPADCTVILLTVSLASGVDFKIAKGITFAPSEDVISAFGQPDDEHEFDDLTQMSYIEGKTSIAIFTFKKLFKEESTAGFRLFTLKDISVSLEELLEAGAIMCNKGGKTELKFQIML